MSIFGPSSTPNYHSPVYITVWAEESGDITKGRYEWSFGNGATNRNSGYTMMMPGLVRKMALTSPRSSLSIGDASVNISVDGVENKDYGVSIPVGKQSVFVDFDIPLLVNVGSIINFVSASNVVKINASVVALLIELIF